MTITINLRGDQIGRYAQRSSDGAEVRLEGVAPLGPSHMRLVLQVGESTLAVRDALGRVVVPVTTIAAPPAPDMDWLLIDDQPFVIDLKGVPTGTATYTVPLSDGPSALPWIAPETLINTIEGAKAAGDLRPGDRVLTRNQGAQPLLWCARIEDRMPAIQFASDALGTGMPHEPVSVSCGQHVLIGGTPVRASLFQSEVLARAEGLLPLETVRETSVSGGVVLVFERHALVMADGIVFDSLYPNAEALRALGPEGTAALVAHLPGLRFDPLETAYPIVRPRLSLAASRTLASVLRRRGARGALRTARADATGEVRSHTDAPTINVRPATRFLN